MQNIKKFIILSATFLMLFTTLALPAISLADGDGTTKPPVVVDSEAGKIHNPLGPTITIPALIQKFLVGAIKIGIPIIALAIIYCGFLFVAARGNSEKIGHAKDALLYTVLGAAILLGSWAIAKLIVTTVQGLG